MAQIDADKFHVLRFKLIIRRFESRRLFLARFTPCAPEVQHHNFATIGAQCQRIATKQRQRKISRWPIGFCGSWHHRCCQARTRHPHNRHNHNPNQSAENYHHEFTAHRIFVTRGGRWCILVGGWLNQEPQRTVVEIALARIKQHVTDFFEGRNTLHGSICQFATRIRLQVGAIALCGCIACCHDFTRSCIHCNSELFVVCWCACHILLPFTHTPTQRLLSWAMSLVAWMANGESLGSMSTICCHASIAASICCGVISARQ